MLAGVTCLYQNSVRDSIYCRGHSEQPSSVALDVGSVLVRVLPAESSFLGSVLQIVGVCTWPCASGLASTAAAEAAAAPPSGVGAVFVRRSVLDLDRAGWDKSLRSRGSETSCAAEGRPLAAYLGVKSWDRT